MFELLFTLLGLVGLWIGSELMIRGALNISDRFKISRMFVGLTILAFLTDLPELFVTITGSYNILQGVDASGLIVGDIIGSSFGQAILMLGILGLFGVLTIKKRQLLRDGFMLLGSVLLLILVGIDGTVSRVEGGMLIFIYLFYLFTLFREEKVQEEKPTQKLKIRLPILYLFIGLAILLYSGNLAINNAVLLSGSWGVSQSFVGILIIGLGTSLPELFVSLTALRHKSGTMAVGNLIGSTIFDLLFVLGLGATISGLTMGGNLIRFDLPILFIFSGIVLILFSRKMKLKRNESLILVGLYVTYAILKIVGLF